MLPYPATSNLNIQKFITAFARDPARLNNSFLIKFIFKWDF
ncbi:hypothetical protein SAMN05444362_108146 [Dysgonomonas macrotermitis]|uniref:Uncharacterized protein n=1 Tax=Dysgonomonas macrotermitis TaxID=1346286 RepID=A0A1M5DC29_9BACT|nr:hypothetical protein SAMN05444362_108146 [Dysgonomonas macrotermitis]